MKTKIGLQARTRMLELLREKQSNIMAALTMQYKGEKITSEMAIGFVAELATIQGLISSLTTEAEEERRSSIHG